MKEGSDRLQAAHYQQHIQKIKAKWHQQNEAPHDRFLNKSFKLGYTASEKEKSNADYRFMLASLHAWREKGLRLWPDQAEAETQKVSENIKAALARRPTWFEPWISLALVKYQSGKVDQELKVALEKAMETGQYETTVHHGVAFVGLRVWDHLEPELRRQVVETIRIALENDNVKGFVVEQIVMTGRFTPFGEQLASDRGLRRLVEKYQKKKEDSL